MKTILWIGILFLSFPAFSSFNPAEVSVFKDKLYLGAGFYIENNFIAISSSRLSNLNIGDSLDLEMYEKKRRRRGISNFKGTLLLKGKHFTYIKTRKKNPEFFRIVDSKGLKRDDRVHILKNKITIRRSSHIMFAKVTNTALTSGGSLDPHLFSIILDSKADHNRISISNSNFGEHLPVVNSNSELIGVLKEPLTKKNFTVLSSNFILKDIMDNRYYLESQKINVPTILNERGLAPLDTLDISFHPDSHLTRGDINRIEMKYQKPSESTRARIRNQKDYKLTHSVANFFKNNSHLGIGVFISENLILASSLNFQDLEVNDLVDLKKMARKKADKKDKGMIILKDGDFVLIKTEKKNLYYLNLADFKGVNISDEVRVARSTVTGATTFKNIVKDQLVTNQTLQSNGQILKSNSFFSIYLSSKQFKDFSQKETSQPQSNGSPVVNSNLELLGTSIHLDPSFERSLKVLPANLIEDTLIRNEPQLSQYGVSVDEILERKGRPRSEKAEFARGQIKHAFETHQTRQDHRIQSIENLECSGKLFQEARD